MDKAEKVFTKLAQSFEQMADQQVQRLRGGIDAYNENVVDKTTEMTGKATGAGAATGAAAGAAYPFFKRPGHRKFLRSALKGGGIGAGIAGAGALAYLLPKAVKSYITRGEERTLADALDTKHDLIRGNLIRQALSDRPDSGATKS